MDNRPLRVLLVEDDEDDYFLTRELLGEVDVGRLHLDWVVNYDAALEAICVGRHEVYLIDYRLGRRDGLELLREAVARGCLPIILLTGQGDARSTSSAGSSSRSSRCTATRSTTDDAAHPVPLGSHPRHPAARVRERGGGEGEHRGRLRRPPDQAGAVPGV